MNKELFDQKLAERMQSHEMQPDDAIWSRIETTLDSGSMIVPSAPKRRLLSIVSAMTAAAAVLLVAFLLLENNEPVKLLKTPVEPKVARGEVPTNDESVMESVVVAQNEVPEREKRVQSVFSSPSSSSDVVMEVVETEEENVVCKTIPESSAREESKERRSVATRVAVTNQPPTTRSYNERTQVKRNGKGSMSINVSGAANFSSSSSVVGNNSGVLAPLKSINHNNVPSLYSAKKENREWTHNMPLSFAVTFQKMFTRKFGIETGLTYTYLYSKSAAENRLDQDIKQHLNYLGVPLSVVYSIAEGKRFGAYAKFGFMVDKALSAKATSYFDDKSQSYDLSRKGVQFSSMLQVGGAYNINNLLSLYIEPTVSYYFDSEQPVSYRTDNEFGFSAIVGVRFKF